MTRHIPFTLAMLLCLNAVSYALAVEDRVIHVDSEDAEMNKAMAAAKAKLPYFWEQLAKNAPGDEMFALKVKFEDDNGVEFFWCGKLERKGDRIFAVLDNDPQTVKNVKLGQKVEVQADQIADWLFVRNGKMVGNYTLRPLMSRMTQEEKAMVEGRLAPLP